MPVDITGEVQAAHKDPDFAAWLRDNVVKPAVVAALAERDADTWLDAAQAARHLYGAVGKAEAFRKLRSRHPALDDLSEGIGKLRRWRRADLDAFVASSPRAKRRRTGAGQSA